MSTIFNRESRLSLPQLASHLSLLTVVGQAAWQESFSFQGPLSTRQQSIYTDTYQWGQEKRSSSSQINNYLDACGFDFWELRKPPYIDLKLSRSMCQVSFQMGHRILSHLLHIFNILPSAHYYCQSVLCKPSSIQFGFTHASQVKGKIQSFYMTMHSHGTDTFQMCRHPYFMNFIYMHVYISERECSQKSLIRYQSQLLERDIVFLLKHTLSTLN